MDPYKPPKSTSGLHVALRLLRHVTPVLRLLLGGHALHQQLPEAVHQGPQPLVLVLAVARDEPLHVGPQLVDLGDRHLTHRWRSYIQAILLYQPISRDLGSYVIDIRYRSYSHI